MSRALVIAAGNTEGIEIKEKYDFVIAADGGYDNAKKLSLRPNLFVGDMDSVKESPKEVEMVKLNVEKDFTDTETAVMEAFSRGFKKIDIIGALGTRFDHSAANAFLLKRLLKMGADARIIDSHNVITAIDKEITLCGQKGKTLSLLAADTVVRGITLEGFKYPLYNAELEIGSTLAVSNVIENDEAKISVTDGTLLVILAKD